VFNGNVNYAINPYNYGSAVVLTFALKRAGPKMALPRIAMDFSLRLEVAYLTSNAHASLFGRIRMQEMQIPFAREGMAGSASSATAIIIKCCMACGAIRV